MPPKPDEVQRSLGRIEGGQIQLLSEIKSLRADFTAHAATDLTSFAAVRNEMQAGFEESTRARNQHLNEQDAKLDGLKANADYAKGAGKVVITAFLGLCSFLGMSVIAALSGWIKFH